MNSTQIIGLLLTLLAFACIIVMAFVHKKEGKPIVLEIILAIAIIVLGYAITKGIDYLINDVFTPNDTVSVNESTNRNSNTVDDTDFQIILGNGPMRMQVGGTYSVTYSFNNPAAYQHDLKWSSSNEECVSVSSNGILTAKTIGEAEISVCFSEPDYKAKKSFMVYVLDWVPSQNDGQLSVIRSDFCEKSRDANTYYIFFDIENPFMKPITVATIEVFAKNGSMPFIIEQPTTSNIAGIFSLNYLDEYVVLASVKTADGEVYYSEPWLLRPSEELSQ